MNLISKLKRIAAVGIAFSTVAGCMTPAMASQSNSTYFTYKLKLPGKKAKTYSSKKTLNLSSAKASSSDAKITLKKVYINGRKLSLSKAKVSVQYISSGDHIISLTQNRSTLSISSKLLKAVAGTGVTPIIAVNHKGTYASSGAEASASVRDAKYRKDIFSSANFVNVKLGRYGTAKTGFSLLNGSFAINGATRKAGSYSWWIAEYKKEGDSWKASDFILVPKAPYTAGSTAYHFSVLRDSKGLTGMKLTDALIRTGDSAETWSVQPSAAYPEGWENGMIFNYKYLLAAPKIRRLKSSSRSSLAVKWAADKNADGYTMQCARNRKFTNCRTQKYTGWRTNGCTAYSLRSRNTYYVRVRSQRTIDGRTYYSPWSKVKTVKVK